MISAIPLLTGLTMVLLCLAFATVVLPMARLTLAVRLLIIIGITLLVLLPLPDYPGWYYLRSFFGDCSITALLFYAAILLRQNFSWQLYQQNELLLLQRMALVAALMLYPFALGLTQFDSYQLGYDNPWQLAVLFLVSLFCWYRKYYFLTLTITAAVVAWSLQLLESRNLWDYLIDPALLLIVILTWVRPTVKNAELAT